MGFCSSYEEVQRFQKNDACIVTADVLSGILGNAVLFAADNVDHNVLTLDSEGTFHDMGNEHNSSQYIRFAEKLCNS